MANTYPFNPTHHHIQFRVNPQTGAYFGLVASYMLTPPEMSANGWDRDNTASYSSDMFAMVGTLFLFLYWPSFSASVDRGCGLGLGGCDTD